MSVDTVTSLLVLSVILNSYLLRKGGNRVILHANSKLYGILSVTLVLTIVLNLFLDLSHDFKLLSYSVLVLLSTLLNCILILDRMTRPYPTGYRVVIKVLFYSVNFIFVAYTLNYIFS
ncbi:hypothetical protein COF68_06240 [Bacillus toyonensis]|nr:hypothetical protein COF68_06240 [Bacillus toyonensis]